LSDPKIPPTKITLAGIKSKRAEEPVRELKQALVPRGRQDAKSSRARRAKERSGEPARKPADSRRVPSASAPAPSTPIEKPAPRHHERRAGGGKAAPAVKQQEGPIAKPPTAQLASSDGAVRLSKLMSEQGFCSRREADEWIVKGWVKVDGLSITELGTRILPTQKITVERQAEKQQSQRVTILLNKPVGYVSGQAEDGYKPASTLITAENRWSGDRSPIGFHPRQLHGLAPAGRLDIDSVGLMVFTQDGRIAKQLIGADSEIEKEYLVRVEGRLSNSDLKLLSHGLSLDDKPLKPAQVMWQNADQLRFILQEGRKRQIRRMCELVGLHVVGLKRVRIGNIMLGDLPVGQWRYLSVEENFA
jgi:23S rRNA pseudouridine2604 synthase